MAAVGAAGVAVNNDAWMSCTAFDASCAILTMAAAQS
jgi:hypothetical protein